MIKDIFLVIFLLLWTTMLFSRHNTREAVARTKEYFEVRIKEVDSNMKAIIVNNCDAPSTATPLGCHRMWLADVALVWRTWRLFDGRGDCLADVALV